MACSPRDGAVAVGVADDDPACGDDDGCAAARADADGASSRRARLALVGSRCAGATSRCRDWSCRACDRHRRPRRRPCRRGSPSSASPIPSYHHLQATEFRMVI